MNVVEEDIRKGTYRRAYLLYGEETYLKEYYAKKLENALFPSEDPVNFTRYSEKEADPSALISQAETMPFFADFRLISVKDSGLFKRNGDALAAFFQSIPDSTIFLFREEEVDKRSKLYKAVRDQGVLVAVHVLVGMAVGGAVRVGVLVFMGVGMLMHVLVAVGVLMALLAAVGVGVLQVVVVLVGNAVLVHILVIVFVAHGASSS